MPIIKRIKAGVTHYAVAIAPAGNVTKWTPLVTEATSFSEREAFAVKGFYKKKPESGSIEPIAAAGDVKMSEAEQKEQEKNNHLVELSAENKLLRVESVKLKAELAELKVEKELLEGQVAELQKKPAPTTATPPAATK